MSYINETDFVIENKELVYPEIVTDGLQIYYDAKGKRDTDYHRDTMLDMSGNKNHGKLHNFAYKKHSGYKDGLVFDYIDDKLVRPELDLKPDDFTFMLNGNIISFSPDGTVKRVQDGEVIEAKGVNLSRAGKQIQLEGYAIGHNIWHPGYNFNLKSGHHYYTYRKLSPISTNAGAYGRLTNLQGITLIDYIHSFSNITIPTSDYNGGFTIYGHNILRKSEWLDLTIIDLTETFGAGNEPTKEQMDEIINQFGFIPNSQDLIDRIEYKGNDLGDMENIIDGLYKTEVLSGEEIYTDKADDSVVHVEVDGKSVGGGNNLFNAERFISENTSGNAKFYSAEEDGSLKIIGVDGTGVISYPTIVYLKPDTNYVMSFSDRINDRFEFVNALGNTVSINKQWNGNTLNFTTNSTTDRMVGKFYPVEQKYPLSVFVKIEEGSVATEYELPAPTPDYPIEIHSLNDFDVFSSIGKRNIILNSSEPMNPYTATTGIESSVTPEGYYKVVASKDNSNWFYPQALYAMRFNGQIEKNFNVGDVFTFSVDIKSPDSTDIPSLYVLGATNTYVPLQGEMGTEFSRFYISSTWRDLSNMNLALGLGGRSGTFIFRRMKLEKGPVPTPWAPAQEEIVESSNHPSIDKINLLLDEPLRSVEDVKDRLFRDSDGLWKIERNVAEYKADGTETWMHRSGLRYDMTTSSLPYPTYLLDNNPHTKVASSHFIRTGGEQTHGSTYVYSRSARIMMDGITVEDIPAFMKNQHDKGTPVTWVYQTQPRTETLSQSLQDKLNNLRSFEDSNYVYTVLSNKNNTLSNNLKPTLHAKFLYNNWYKEDRVINNLMIYNRALTNEEMLQNYKTIKRRWGM